MSSKARQAHSLTHPFSRLPMTNSRLRTPKMACINIPSDTSGQWVTAWILTSRQLHWVISEWSNIYLNHIFRRLLLEDEKKKKSLNRKKQAGSQVWPPKSTRTKMTSVYKWWKIHTSPSGTQKQLPQFSMKTSQDCNGNGMGHHSCGVQRAKSPEKHLVWVIWARIWDLSLKCMCTQNL